MAVSKLKIEDAREGIKNRVGLLKQMPSATKRLRKALYFGTEKAFKDNEETLDGKNKNK